MAVALVVCGRLSLEDEKGGRVAGMYGVHLKTAACSPYAKG
jgi:hypothetical protein